MNAVVQEAEAPTVNALAPPKRAALALRSVETEKQLTELAQTSKTIVVVTNEDGREQAHRAMMTLRNMRVDLEKRGKSAREDATAFSKAVIAEEARLVAIIEPEEDRLQVLRDAWDNEQKAIKAAAIEKERQRVEAHQLAIAAIELLPTQLASASSAEIARAIEALSARDVSAAVFEDWSDNARAARLTALEKLMVVKGEAIAREAEVARLEAERQQKEADEAAERERIRLEGIRLAEEGERLRKVREQQEAETKRLAAEQAEIDRKREEQEKAAREQQEAIAQQQRDQEQRNRELQATLAAQQREQEERAAAEQRRQEADAACNSAIANINALHAQGVSADTIEAALAAISVLDELTFSQDEYGEDVADVRDARDQARFAINNRIRQIKKIADDEAELARQRAQLEEQRNAPAPAPTPIGADTQEGAGPAAPAAPEPAITARPPDEELVGCVMAAYSVSEEVATQWLRDFDL